MSAHIELHAAKGRFDVGQGRARNKREADEQRRTSYLAHLLCTKCFALVQKINGAVERVAFASKPFLMLGRFSSVG